MDWGGPYVQWAGWCLHKREEREVLMQRQRHTQGEDGHVKTGQKLVSCCHKPKNNRGHQQVEEARDKFSLEPVEETGP